MKENKERTKRIKKAYWNNHRVVDIAQDEKISRQAVHRIIVREKLTRKKYSSVL